MFSRFFVINSISWAHLLQRVFYRFCKTIWHTEKSIMYFLSWFLWFPKLSLSTLLTPIEHGKYDRQAQNGLLLFQNNQQFVFSSYYILFVFNYSYYKSYIRFVFLGFGTFKQDCRLFYIIRKNFTKTNIRTVPSIKGS